jgi:hypothetical protein
MGTGTPDINLLVAELRTRVAARRREGAYPPGFEHGLDDQARLLLHRRVHSLRPVDVAGSLAQIREALPISTQQPAAGARLEQLGATLTERQTAGVVGQIQAFAEPVRQSLEALAAAVEELSAEVQLLRPPLLAVLRRQALEESRAVQAAARRAAGAGSSG